MRKDTAVEELSIYNLTITSDHRLKVNNEDVGGDESILPGDSESLLAWALIQVGYIQEDSTSNMALQIEDQRPDGYGTQKVSIPPGRRVLIETLRKRTGRDLSYVTEQVHQQYETQQTQEPAAPETQSEPEQSWSESAWETNPAEEESKPEVASVEPQEQWADQEATQAPTDTEPVPAPATAPEARDEEFSRAPDAELQPVPAPEPPRRERQRSYDQPLPEEPVAQPVDDVDAWAAEPPAPQGLDQFSDNWPTLTDAEPFRQQAEPPQEQPAPSQSAVNTLPSVSPFAQPEVTEHEDIASERVTYKRDRPEMGEDEAQKAKKKKVKKERSKPMIAALVIVSLIAVFFAVQFIRSQGDNSYVATCIDERTMVRQSSDAGCKDDEAAAYYRWWYTPSGSEVPAVNQTVSQDQGTRIRPENASIREGYDAGGGLYGDEDEG